MLINYEVGNFDRKKSFLREPNYCEYKAIGIDEAKAQTARYIVDGTFHQRDMRSTHEKFFLNKESALQREVINFAFHVPNFLMEFYQVESLREKKLQIIFELKQKFNKAIHERHV